MIKQLLGICLAVALLVACASPAAPGGKPHVVATTTMIGDIARNIAGDQIVVTTLLQPGVDPHEYDPAPADLQALSQAKVVFANGAGLEPWLPRLLATTPSIRVKTLTDGLKLRTFEEDGATVSDPHVWFDVANVIYFAEQIRDTLVAIDAAHAETYRQNATNYIVRLTELDNSIRQQVQALPADRRKLVTNHDTFGYFAARYGFDVVGTVFATGGAEASPSAQQVAALINTIKAANVRAVFTENTLNPDLAQTIAQEAGVKVITELFTDSLGPQGSPAATYIDLMTFDVKTIIDALK